MQPRINLGSLLKRNGFLLALIFVLFMLFLITLSWVINSRLHDFEYNQSKLAQHSVQSTAMELEQYIAHSRQLANILVKASLSELKKLVHDPENQAYRAHVKSLIESIFPEALNYAIANEQGELILQQPKEFIGNSCRKDINRFASGLHMNEIYVHSNPDPKSYHIDILAPINKMLNNKAGTFFVSLDTSKLQRLLMNGQINGHRLYITRPDKAGLIELTAKGPPVTINRPDTLQDKELPNTLARIDINNTRWQLVDVIDESVKARFYYLLLRDSTIVGVSFLLLLTVFIIAVLRIDLKRWHSEQKNQELNETLEQRVQQRTKELLQSKEKLSHQATHDFLTNLINRREFEQRLKHIIEHARNDKSVSAILYTDLDQFKVVNDMAGHAAGDALLQEITALLRKQLRSSDTLARLGGDEFGILLENCSLERAAAIAEHLRSVVDHFKFHWNGKQFAVGLSIGVTQIDQYSTSVNDIMSTVDTACYAAKDNGRNTVHIYDPDDTLLKMRRSEMYWSSAAIQAIQDDRLELHCQMIAPLSSDIPYPWYEVLVRLRDEDDQLIYPDRFIPALERFGGIDKLDLAVMTETAKFMSDHPACCFNVNISGTSFGDKSFHEKIAQLLEQHNVNPQMLILEMTETATVYNFVEASRFITQMRQLGCRIALDDFGSGMSSFGILKQLDIDFIKLDGSFVRDINSAPEHRTMVAAINSIAQVMGKMTIAEFVENQEIADLLKEIGIDYAQGYLFHTPTPLHLLHDQAKPELQ